MISLDERGPDDADALHAAAARLAGIGAWRCDLSTGRLAWTDEVRRLFGLAADAVLERAGTVALYEDESREHMEALRRDLVLTGRPFVLDACIRPRAGERRWMRLSAACVRENGRVVRLFGAKQDITAERETMERLRRLAEHDALTGLANRNVFEARCRDMVGDRGSATPIGALVLVDLDGFKAINDRHGHAAGDACLREAAARLGRAFPEADLVARIGGDEFAILLRGPLDRVRLAAALDRGVRTLSRPVPWPGGALPLGASFGAALLGGRRPTRSEIFDEADRALYAAKAAGRGCARIVGSLAIRLTA